MSGNYYDINAEKFIAETAQVDMSALYDRFLKWVPDGGSILDAGSGSGRDARAFKDRGYDVWAFDASPAMVAATRELANVPTFNMTFETMEFSRSFNGIWACASLLHVPRNKLAAVMVRMAEILTPQGVIYASFKFGKEERNSAGRYFNNQDEVAIGELADKIPNLALADVWITKDQRPERQAEKWINCILVRS